MTPSLFAPRFFSSFLLPHRLPRPLSSLFLVSPCFERRDALYSHDVTRVGQREHHRGTRELCTNGARMCEDRRERGGGREREKEGGGKERERVETLSNHALCLRRHACHAPPTLTRLSALFVLFLFTLHVSSLFFLLFSYRRLARNRPTGRLRFSLFFLSLSHTFSLSLSPLSPPSLWSFVSSDFVSLSTRLSPFPRSLSYRGCTHFSSLPFVLLPLSTLSVRLSKKALHRLRIRRFLTRLVRGEARLC